MDTVTTTRSQPRGERAERAPADITRGRRARNLALWALQVLTAAAFLMAGSGKLTGDSRALSVFDAMGAEDWLRYVLGVLEILGAVGLLIPRLAGLSGLAFVALTAGAVIVHVAIGMTIVLPGVLLLFAAVIAWGRRERTASLFARRAS